MSGGSSSRNRSRSRSSDLRAEAGRLYSVVYQGNRDGNGDPRSRVVSGVRPDHAEPGSGDPPGRRGVYERSTAITQECGDHIRDIGGGVLATANKLALVQLLAQLLGVEIVPPLGAGVGDSDGDDASTSESGDDIPDLSWGQSWAGYETIWADSLRDASIEARDQGEQAARRWQINSEYRHGVVLDNYTQGLRVLADPVLGTTHSVPDPLGLSFHSGPVQFSSDSSDSRGQG